MSLEVKLTFYGRRSSRPVQMGSSPRADRFDSGWRMAQNRAFRKEIKMERELEKDLKEIEYLIYVHKNRGNTNTQSVLERVYEIIEPCAKAAKTLPELEELLSCENTLEITRSTRDNDGWIPVDDRLPEEPKENPVFDDKPLELYLVDMGGSYPLRAFWNGKEFTDGWSVLKVTAWMPLPEPYRPERSRENENEN